MRKQTKKEKEVIDKFKIDTKGMTSSQIIEYMKLSEVEKENFINRFRNQCRDIRLPIAHENLVKKEKKDKKKRDNLSESYQSCLIKKEGRKDSEQKEYGLKVILQYLMNVNVQMMSRILLNILKEIIISKIEIY